MSKLVEYGTTGLAVLGLTLLAVLLMSLLGSGAVFASWLVAQHVLRHWAGW
jgi:hypothetical protein